ncbi:hypothetical protein ACFL5M_00875 [Candidatus Neomarinimicrobiota bacterium]
MKITIQPYKPGMEKMASRFNQRLEAGRIHFRFPETHQDSWLPAIEGRKISREYFLAVENGSEVRGGYILKHQDFLLRGKIYKIGNYQLPLSEGIINRTYSLVGVQLLADAVKSSPLLFALGMGGLHQPLPRLLKSSNWTLIEVPFYFRVVHPGRFLHRITHLRRSRFRRILLDTAVVTGLGWIGHKIWTLAKAVRCPRLKPVSIERIPNFGSWADELWQRCQGNYSFCAVRDAETLNILYPSDEVRFIRLKIAAWGKPIGWVVLLNTKMSQHKQFGDLQVGSIVDCLALNDYARELIAAAADYLKTAKVDLIVTNQSNEMYGAALRASGFLSGPSNFIFAASRELSRILAPMELHTAHFHLNRGDGDGPIHL